MNFKDYLLEQWQLGRLDPIPIDLAEAEVQLQIHNGVEGVQQRITNVCNLITEFEQTIKNKREEIEVLQGQLGQMQVEPLVSCQKN